MVFVALSVEVLATGVTVASEVVIETSVVAVEASTVVVDAGGSEMIVPPPETGGSVTVMVWEVATIFPLRISLTVNTSEWSPWLVNVSPLLTSAALNV